MAITVNYTVRLDSPSTANTNIDFKQDILLKDGTKFPVQKNITIPAGKTEQVVEVKIEELNINDLATQGNTLSESADLYDVAASGKFNVFDLQTLETTIGDIPLPQPQESQQKEGPCSGEITIDKIIKALQNKGYSWYAGTPSGVNYLNVVGIRNSDKDFGSSAGFPLVINNPLNQPPLTQQQLTAAINQGPATKQQGYLGAGKKGKTVQEKFTDWLAFWYYKEKPDPNDPTGKKKTYERVQYIGRATTLPGIKYQKTQFFTADYDSFIPDLNNPKKPKKGYTEGGKGQSLGRVIRMLEGKYPGMYVLGKHKLIPDTMRLNENYKSTFPVFQKDTANDGIYTFNGFYEGEFWDSIKQNFVPAGANSPYTLSQTRIDGAQLATQPAANVHPSGKASGPNKNIGPWSAGCQVWREKNEWKKMSDACLWQVNKTDKKTFDYTLLHIRDIPGFENCYDKAESTNIT